MPPKIADRRSAGSVHDNSLPQWAIDKMARRRGRRYAFENIDPARTALVVIDLVKAALESTPCAASIIDPVLRLASTLRAAGGTIVWVTPAPVAPRSSHSHGAVGRRTSADDCRANSKRKRSQ